MPPRKPPLQKSELQLVLTLLTGPCEGQVFNFDTFPLVVGRKRTNKVFIKDPVVSEQHAELFCKEGHWYIKELGSSNGTVINSEKFSCEDAPRMLQHGDEVLFGSESLALVELVSDAAKVEQWLNTKGLKNGLEHERVRREAIAALEAEMLSLTSQYSFALKESLVAAQQWHPEAFAPAAP